MVLAFAAVGAFHHVAEVLVFVAALAVAVAKPAAFVQDDFLPVFVLQGAAAVPHFFAALAVPAFEQGR